MQFGVQARKALRIIDYWAAIPIVRIHVTIRVVVDPISARYLSGAEVDFVDTVTGGGFTIKNPNATSTCGCGSSFTTEEGGGDHGHSH